MEGRRVFAARYEVMETLARSAEREELRARDLTLGREVLLVRSLAAPLAGQPSEQRALREARALASLRHTGIQRLHDVLEDPAGPVLVLEPATGETLAARLARETRLPHADVRALGIELADALAAVHAAGAVHRDVSAENVYVRADGSSYLAGFRLAKPVTLSGGTSIQYGRTALGDSAELALLPRYPAPEQLVGESASARTDLYALGNVLYRALTGQEALPELLASGWKPAEDPRRSVPEVPRELAQLVLACLARTPVGRPQSAAELRDALRSAGPVRATGRRAPQALIGAAAALLLALAAWRVWPRADEAQSTERGLAASNTGASADTAAYAPGFAHSRALLIGIATVYARQGFPPLANAVRDVVAVDEALRALPRGSWETTVLAEEDATYDNIRAELARLDSTCGKEDQVLVYFAGHGEPHADSNSSGWLLPADAETLAQDPTHKRWLHFNEFSQFLMDVKAKHALIAMDCCYGGRLAEQMRSAGARAYEERFTTQKARVVLASGRANEQVQDGDGHGHSPFADVFLHELGAPQPAFTSSQLYAEMLRTFNETHVQQTPVLDHPAGVAAGEFVFLRE